MDAISCQESLWSHVYATYIGVWVQVRARSISLHLVTVDIMASHDELDKADIITIISSEDEANSNNDLDSVFEKKREDQRKKDAAEAATYRVNAKSKSASASSKSAPAPSSTATTSLTRPKHMFKKLNLTNQPSIHPARLNRSAAPQ